jgi:hypothetical protein
MSTRIIGRAREGRRLKAGNSGVKPIEVNAATGDASTANSATPFFKFTSQSGSTTDGDVPVTTSDVTGGGAAPGGTSKAILVDVKGTQYWIPLYAVA